MAALTLLIHGRGQIEGNYKRQGIFLGIFNNEMRDVLCLDVDLDDNGDII